MSPPIIFIVFNRPEPTRLVFEAIRKAGPGQLFIVADGPRPHVPEDEPRCTLLRRELLDAIDWDCEVFTDFSAENLGCGHRVSSGITWAFQHVEEAIILEDDCVPSSSFFPYCADLLQRYRDDSRVMSIAGARLCPFGPGEPDAPYTLSAYFHSWGWATWRSSWAHYEHDMSNWRSRFSPAQIQNLCGGSARLRDYWAMCFDATHSGQLDTWDYRFMLSSWEQNAFTIVPRVNQVRNIGFGDDATHTSAGLVNPCTESDVMKLPMRHPDTILRNHVYERSLSLNMRKPSIPERALYSLKKLLKASA